MFYLHNQSGLTGVADSRGVTDYNFDGKGRLVSVSTPEGTLHYAWDDQRDLLERVSTGDAQAPTREVEYAYDALRRLTTVRVVRQDGQAVNIVTDYTYGPLGQVTTVSLPNGIAAAYSYDDMVRLTGVTYTDDQSAVVQSAAYTLDVLGRRTRVETFDGTNTRTVDYTYDPLGRLIEENINSGAQVVSYSYDLAGNRLERDDSVAGVTTYVYDDDDRLTTETRGDTVVVYTYDDSGRTAEKLVTVNSVETEHIHYSYDARGFLAAVDLDDDTIDDLLYEYDTGGRLVGRDDGGVEVDYLIDDLNPTGYSQVVEESDAATGDLLAAYTFGPTGITAQFRAGSPGSTHHYLTDGSGSVAALADASGAITDRYTYDTFGGVITSTGGTVNPHLFTGERFDSALGQYELRARRYDPSNGRFTSGDPLHGTDPAVLNQYVYALSDPVNLSDPSGNISILSVLKTVVIAADVIAMALPVYRAATSVNQLLDTTEFVIAIRRGLDRGWLDFGEYMPMHGRANNMAAQLAAQAVGSLVPRQSLILG